MLKEIGSNFWLSSDNQNLTELDTTIFNIEFDDFVLLSSGRNAISQVLNDISDEKKIAMLPAFTCDSVIKPFIKCGYQINYYQLLDDTTIDEESFVYDFCKLKPSIILIHSYFGFNTSKNLISELESIKKQDQITIIEDITQTLYSSFSRLPSDFVVGSFRKWAGIPDGGFALKRKGLFYKKPDEEDTSLTNEKIKAMKMKRDFILFDAGKKDVFLRTFANAEDLLERQNALFLMSDYSKKVQANLDVSFLKARRKDNYLFLLNNVNNPTINPLFRSLPDDVVPLYFPVFCNGDRSSFQSYLRENNIYAPVVWPKSKHVNCSNNCVERLYNSLICIPCDQRYGREEMEFVVKIINKWNQ